MARKKTMIRVFKDTCERLKEFGKKGDTYDQIINRVLDEVKEREKKRK